MRHRIFTRRRELQRTQLARLTQIDYDREMAFLATRQDTRGEWEILGVAHAIADPDKQRAEFAIIVRSDLKGQGLGTILLKKLIEYCRSQGIQEMAGEALAHNERVLRLAQHFGFEIEAKPEAGTVLLRLRLISS